MDLNQKVSSMRSSDSAVQRTHELDRTTAQMCFGTSAGLLAVGTCGCLAELTLGMGGHLQGLLVFSFGYLCCGLKQQASIWLAMRGVAKERLSQGSSARAEGCLPHSEVLPARCSKAPSFECAARFRTKSMSCI